VRNLTLITSVLSILSIPALSIASPAYIGVELRDLTPDRAAELRLTNTSGAEVVALAATGPARKAGLQEGDVIVTLNDRPVASASEFTRSIQQIPAGSFIRLEVMRNGRLALIGLTGRERPADLDSQFPSTSPSSTATAPSPPNGFRRNDVPPPAPLPMIASNDNVTGIWEGTAIAPRSSKPFSVRLDLTQSDQGIQGRETESAQKVPLSLVRIDGQLRRHSVVIRELEELASNTGAPACLQTARLTLSEDGAQMTGRYEASNCGDAVEVTLTRNWPKTQHWQVCSSQSVTSAMTDLLSQAAKDPVVERGQNLASLFGATMEEKLGGLLAVQLSDFVYKPNTFTCVAVMEKTTAAEIDRGNSDDEPSDSLANEIMKGLKNVPGTYFFMLSGSAGDGYTVTYKPRTRLSKPYSEAVSGTK
jgi:hypothetical protein